MIDRADYRIGDVVRRLVGFDEPIVLRQTASGFRDPRLVGIPEAQSGPQLLKIRVGNLELFRFIFSSHDSILHMATFFIARHAGSLPGGILPSATTQA